MKQQAQHSMKQVGILIAFVFTLPAHASANCDDAYHSCRKQCDSITTLLNIEQASKFSASNTDFLNNCKDSCRRGRRFCNVESNPQNAYKAFISRCESSCPTIVVSMSKQSALSNTNANASCKKACSSSAKLNEVP